MKYTLAQTLNHNLRWLLAIGALSAVIVQGLYWYKFARGHWFELSNDPAVWGAYGDYLGGILNPIFSSLAFSGLVITIVLQARQIDESKHQANLEEMQRVASTLATRVDELLSSTFELRKDGNNQDRFFVKQSQSVFKTLSALGTAALTEPVQGERDWQQWLWNDVSSEPIKRSLDNQTVPLRLELENLSYMLLKYRERGGSEDVLEFYGYRYRAIVVWMFALKLLEVHGQIQMFFEPAKFKAPTKPTEGQSTS